jgi:phosphatidate cytidylyltransferase
VKSVLIIYLVIFVYYLLGTTGIYFINRKKDPVSRYKAWEKHITYFLLVSILFFSIAIRVVVFRYVAALIIAVGFSELIKLYIESGYRNKLFFLTSLLIFAFFSGSFFVFTGMGQGLILFSFLILCIFDGFSQVTGQLLGKRKLFPRISPNKTVEGLAGGSVVAILSALVFKDLIPADPGKALITATVVVFFAFAGDAAKSLYKRKYNVKDFSKLIPGHGGFLDRFDSLIAGGAGVALLGLIYSLPGSG